MNELISDFTNWLSDLGKRRRYHLTPLGYTVATVFVIVAGILICAAILFL